MKGKRIFLVDDEQENLDYLKEIISDTGFEAVSFTDPKAALAAMRRETPAMAFLDVQMPGMNGLQLLQAIRDEPTLVKLPVALLSAIGAVTGETYTPDLIQARYGVKPDAFVPKPIEPQRVLDAVGILKQTV